MAEGPGAGAKVDGADCVGDTVEIVIGTKTPSVSSLLGWGLLMTVLLSSLLMTPPWIVEELPELPTETVVATEERELLSESPA